MVHVAFDATPLLGVRTGIGNAVAGWLAELAKRPDLDVAGYGLTLSGWRSLPGRLPAGVRAGRVPLPAGALTRLWTHRDLAPVEWWGGRRVDVVHGTNFVVPPARRAARVVTVWDLTCVRYPELCAPAALRYPAVVARAVDRGATVHVLARTVADEVATHFGVPEDRLVVIPPGVGGGAGVGSGPGAEARVGAGERAAGVPLPPAGRGLQGAPYLLALGTVEPRKDLPGLVRAFDALAGRHPDLGLKIAGPAGWGEEALRAAIAAAAHRSRIERLGWVPDPARLLREAAVFAFPSVYEGFGFPPLEAMAAGVPVVATAAGAIPEVLGDAALLVPPGDVDALAGALEQAIDDGELRARLVAAGAARVDRYDWGAAGAALAALYEDVAAGRG